MSDCERYAELISAMIDGEISKNEKAEIEAHASECPECKKMLEAFTAVSESLEELEDVPSGLHDSIMQGVKRESKKKKPAWTKIIPLAACLAVVIFGGVKLLKPPVSDGDKAELADTYVCAENSMDSDSGDGEYADIIFARNTVFDKKAGSSDQLDSAESEILTDEVNIVPAQLRELLTPVEGVLDGASSNESGGMVPYCTVIFHDANGDEEVQVFIDGDEVYADFGDGPVLVSGTAQEIIDMIG